MGSRTGPEFEQPVHRVTLDGFWAYKHEVTNAQFAEFAEATGFAGTRWREQSGGRDRHPVVEVTWPDAQAYCQWAGVALPTEAQWEYAARGPRSLTYPWGNQWNASKLCWWWNKPKSGQVKTIAVGGIPAGASWCGALDMAGNVYEWCADWYDPHYYAASPAKNPAGPDTGEERVMRGGAWHSVLPVGCQASFRAAAEPSHHCYCLGFRGVAVP
jgi:iron(II)-dependent oxidoreductase